MEDYKKILSQLLDRNENEVIEFKTAANQFDTNKLGCYFSALSNEANLRNADFSWLIMGVDDSKNVVGTRFLESETSREAIKYKISMNMTGNFSFRDIMPVEVDGKRVLLFKIPASPHNIVSCWKGVPYARVGESLVPMTQDKQDEIRNQSPLDDWSSHFVEDAKIEDLDELALAKARIEYKKVHSRIPVAEIDGWGIPEFLTYTGLMRKGKLTRAALLLLGKEFCVSKLHPAVARITWMLVDQEGVTQDYEHFTTPFILTVDAALAKIRNLTMRELPGGTLFPDTMQQYDDYVIRETMHNAIAHQDYEMHERINFIEGPDYLYYENGGSFLPGTVENALEYIGKRRFYRNDCLCQAMVNFNMIDTASRGIRKVFDKQKERHFPMPDYTIDNANRLVGVKIYGRTIDEKYAQLLMTNSSLSLRECIWLDAVQKHLTITDKAKNCLRSKKLIEGRSPNLRISLSLAKKINQIPSYTRKKGLDKERYNNMILQYIDNTGEYGAMRNDIYEYLAPSLPEDKDVRRGLKFVSNILMELKRNGLIINSGLRWILNQTTD